MKPPREWLSEYHAHPNWTFTDFIQAVQNDVELRPKYDPTNNIPEWCQHCGHKVSFWHQDKGHVVQVDCQSLEHLNEYRKVALRWSALFENLFAKLVISEDASIRLIAEEIRYILDYNGEEKDTKTA